MSSLVIDQLYGAGRKIGVCLFNCSRVQGRTAWGPQTRGAGYVWHLIISVWFEAWEKKGEAQHTCWPLNGGFIARGLEEDKRFENTMNFGKNGIFEELEWNWRIGVVWERLASIVCHWRIGQWRDALRTGIVCSDCMLADNKIAIVKWKGIVCTKWYCNVSNMTLNFFFQRLKAIYRGELRVQMCFGQV